MNLSQGLAEQIIRNQELLEQYKKIGVAGNFGYVMIKQSLDYAIRTQASGDILEMLRAYDVLKENE